MLENQEAMPFAYREESSGANGGCKVGNMPGFLKMNYLPMERASARNLNSPRLWASAVV
jgi:hypothetical protein